jgi:hypothetical protein
VRQEAGEAEDSMGEAVRGSMTQSWDTPRWMPSSGTRSRMTGREGIMRVDQVFPSKYLKASDLRGREWTLVIEKFEMTPIWKAKKQVQTPTLRFERARKPLILNKTNMLLKRPMLRVVDRAG